MARVIEPPGAGGDGRRTRDERGQLLVATGFGIAAILVILSLVLSSATYTENLATQREEFVDQRVARYETDVERGASELVVAVNDGEDNSYGELWQSLDGGVENWSDLSGREAAVDGVGTDVVLLSTVNGTLIEQDTATRNFTNASGVANWTVAESVNGVRRYRMNVSRESLATPSSGSCGPAECFRIIVDNGTDTWSVALRGNNTSVTVSVEGPTVSGECVVSGDWVPINLTAGTVDGSDCEPLSFAAGVDGSTEIRYEQGGLAAGTYELTVDGVAPGSNYASTGSPHTSPAVYSATVGVTYRTAELTYETTVRVAPGEPDA